MSKTMKIVGIGILTAIIVVLSYITTGFKLFGMFSITFSLIPIVVGAALYGPLAGAWLGFVFGCMCLTDAAAFLAVSVPGTIITCILKGTMAGLAAGLVYKLLSNKNRYAATIASAVVSPIANTGVFLLGCLVFFYDTVKMWGEGAGFESVGAYFLFGFVGINFLVEMAVNIVLSTVIFRVINIAIKNKNSNEV